MISAVDSNILLDIITEDPVHGVRSRELLRRALNDGALLICDVVYAEISPVFPSKDQVDALLTRLDIALVDSGPDVAFLAGRKWWEYRRSGGTRARLLADFLIGAHAQVHAERFITRDRGFYRSHFLDLVILEP